jgi:hypothetical protein
LVAVGAVDGYRSDGAVWTSPDGRTWSRVEAEPSVFGDTDTERDQVITDVVAGPTHLVAVGVDGRPGDFDGAVWLSSDGLAWERVSDHVFEGAGNQAIHAVVHTSDLAVAVGEAEGSPAVWVSQDGHSWSRGAIDGTPADAGVQPGAIFDVAVGGPGLVAVGSSGQPEYPAVWLSADGRSWSRLPGAVAGDGSGVEEADTHPGRMTLVAAGDPGLMAIAATAQFDWRSFAQPVVWTSSDGFVWQRPEGGFPEPPPGSMVALGDVIWTHDGWLVVGGYEATEPGWGGPGLAAVWVSGDGENWLQATRVDAVSTADGINDPPLAIAPGARHLTHLGDSLVVIGHSAVPTEKDEYGYLMHERTPAVWIATLAES